ncbi:pirin-like C-terminal cupin domain-containing protein [Nocardia sp. NPDC050710]|uniref:pirin family protein n=1 Tax=Nocardia sp. NPDC050710 TaxID=3157220 RepID=UPI0033FC41A9
MTTAADLPAHPVAAVRDHIEDGPASSVDNSALILPPGDWAASDPFLLLAEDRFSTAGFGWHPHRGFETITYVVAGELELRDNRGGYHVLNPGDAQWITAGRGVLYAETALRGEPVHTLQLWVNLPASDKLTEPACQDLRGAAMPVRGEDGVAVRVFSGRSGTVIGPATNHVPVTMIDATMEPGRGLSQEIPAGQRGFAYLLAGRGRFGAERTTVCAGQTVHLDAVATDTDTAFEVNADGAEPLHFLLWTGHPLGEPVVAYGPFVMNSEAQIRQTMQDYQRGAFGPTPAH